MTKLIYSHFRTGKCLMQELQWENLECKNCGEHMEVCECNEFEEVKICPRCGKKHMLIKKVRKEDG